MTECLIRLVLLLITLQTVVRGDVRDDLQQLTQRMVEMEGELRQYKAELTDLQSYKVTAEKEKEIMKSAIGNLENRVNKCTCGQSHISRSMEKSTTMESRQVSGAVITDALSALMSHFKHQGIEVPGVTENGRANKTTDSISSGSVYTRWGRKTCDGDADLLYEGFTAGAYHIANSGGGANYLCLPTSGPEYNKYDEADPRPSSVISGTEYEVKDNGIFPKDAIGKNVPCARCYVKRSARMMLPARRTCPDTWTKEYEGYLMTSLTDGHQERSMYECVDSEPEYITGSHIRDLGALFYFVIPDCTGSGTTGHCPPYYEKRQLTCVVCTK